MDISVSHHFVHPAARVFASLVDPDDLRAKYEALGHRDVEIVEVTEEGTTVTVQSRRVVPLDVPGFARKILSPTNTVVQTDEWTGPDRRGERTGVFRVDAKGVPVDVRGRLRLTPDGPGACTFEIDVHVHCGVPLVGRKVADLVGKDTRRAVEHEGTWIAERLAAT